MASASSVTRKIQLGILIETRASNVPFDFHCWFTFFDRECWIRWLGVLFDKRLTGGIILRQMYLKVIKG